MQRLTIVVSAAAALMCGAASAANLPHFTPPNAIWNEDVSTAPLRVNSAAMMTHLESLAMTEHPAQTGKYWGDSKNNQDFQIDFSFYVMHATNETPTAVVPYPDADSYYYPDCGDFHVPGQAPKPAPIPLPVGGGIEGTVPPSYTTCANDGEDCHLLVQQGNTLFESYATNEVAGKIGATCALTWNLSRVYPRYGRGEHCTSADGAGFPIAPLLFNADEVWAAAQAKGDIGHAIRWIIGNERMQKNTHVHPSSHGTTATSDTDPNAVPYGSRLRLKGSFDVNGFSTNEAVRAVLRTLQKYGMFLSDGGGIPLTAEADDFNQHKWADVSIDSHSFFTIRPTDFEVVEAGDPIANNGPPNSGDCTLTPADFLFIDGFDF